MQSGNGFAAGRVALTFKVRVVLDVCVCLAVCLYPPREQRRRSGGSRTTLRAETVQSRISGIDNAEKEKREFSQVGQN